MARLLPVALLSAALLACSGAPSADGADPVVDEPMASAPVSPGTARGVALRMSGDVRIIPEPGDGGAALIDAIKHAATSVHMTMYILTDPGIQDALVARRAAGIEVKVVLNKRFDSPGATNQPAFDKLHAAGVDVVWAPSTFVYTHEKCVVIDGGAAWIMTMNAAKSSLTRNREFLAVDTTPGDVAEAEAQFAADFSGQAFVPSGDLLVAPTNARAGILSLLNGAERSIDFEVESMSDPEIVTALCGAVTRGVTTRGALSNGDRSNPAERAVTQLKACGVMIGTVARPYLHAKAIVADGARAYVGSVNFTKNSMDRNRELGLVTDNPTAVAQVAPIVAGDVTSATPL